jgi:hypothetical protein
MLRSIAHRAERAAKETPSVKGDVPVAWREVNYGPTKSEQDEDYSSARAQWNVEQSIRRALRSLERRGLVELDRYCFRPEPRRDVILWNYIHPKKYVAGEGRMMTGVVLTAAGKAMAVEEAEIYSRASTQ